MYTYIKKLQSKSESVRKQILFGSLIISMSIVFLVWISSLGYRFGGGATAQVEEDIKPFALFGKTITDTYSNVTASVGNISSQAKKENEEVSQNDKVEIEKQIDLIPVENQ